MCWCRPDVRTPNCGPKCAETALVKARARVTELEEAHRFKTGHYLIRARVSCVHHEVSRDNDDCFVVRVKMQDPGYLLCSYCTSSAALAGFKGGDGDDARERTADRYRKALAKIASTEGNTSAGIIAREALIGGGP